MKKWLLVLICCVLTFSHADAVSGPRRVLLFGKAKAIVIGNLPLDGVSAGVKACYSTRQLLTAYAGNALQVTRASDSTTSNIGFTANVLNTTALGTFCSATTCSVSIWYDQCGGGFNLTPAAAGNRPIIFQSGATQAINTKPAVLFVSANSHYLQNASLVVNPTNTLYQNAILSITSTTTKKGISSSLLAGGLEWAVNITTNTFQMDAANTAAIATSTGSLTVSTGAIAEVQYNSVTGAWAYWINSATSGSGTKTQTLTQNSPFLLGTYLQGAQYFDGLIGEYIAYDLVGGIPSASQTALEANQKTYWGTP